MAYINKDSVIDIIDNSADIQEVKSCVFMLENEDVIKRADYDEVVQAYKLLVDLKTLRVTHLEDIINNLCSKINKAIEEMNNIDLNEYADNSYQLVEKCKEILKKI